MQRITGSLAPRGCYTLVIGLRRKRRLRVGSLGKACFPRGTYLYTGSAMNGLRGRLSRHLRKRNKKNHWHIDYLLRCPETRVKDVLVYSSPLQECRINRGLLKLDEAQVVFKGFGSSDCVSGCASHLLYLARPYSRDLTAKLSNAMNLKDGGPKLWRPLCSIRVG